MGKGKGSGGCGDVMEMGMEVIRTILCCLCCICCTGPVLCIIGLFMLLGSNNFAEYVDEYNVDNAKFKKDTEPTIKTTTGTLEGGTTTFSSSSTPMTQYLDTRDDTINSATSYTIGSSGSIDMSAATVNIELSSDAGTSTIAVPGNLKKDGERREGTVTCSRHQNSGNKKSSGTSSCSSSDVAQMCRNRYSGSTYNGGTCSSGSSCGPCVWYQAPKYLCVQIELGSEGTWKRDALGDACEYIRGDWVNPMQTSGSKLTSGSTVPVRFMASDDPYITLQRITSGRNSFGITATQQRLTGLALLIVGALIITCLSCIVCAIWKHFSDKPEEKAHIAQAWGGGGAPPPEGQYQQMQPQEGGGYPPQGYPPQGDQAYPPAGGPDYGAPPPPGYGQPPPATGGYGPPPQYSGL